MSVYAIAVCDICGKEKRSPVNHPSDSTYWKQYGGRRPNGWEYHQSHSGDSAGSVLFCDDCEEKVAVGTEKVAVSMIKEAANG